MTAAELTVFSFGVLSAWWKIDFTMNPWCQFLHETDI